jgi:hypothetical protein
MKSRLAAAGLILGAFISMTVAAPVDAAKPGKYKEVVVADGATVKGKVSFEGPVPADAVENILITKNVDVCGEGEREVSGSTSRTARCVVPSSLSTRSRKARNGKSPSSATT